MITVYIASPYTAGDQAANVRAQMDAADELMTLGYCPVAPLMSHFMEVVHPRPYTDWLRVDMELLSRCDVVLRLPGWSPGADKEVEFAGKHRIPVVCDIKQLCWWASNTSPAEPVCGTCGRCDSSCMLTLGSVNCRAAYFGLVPENDTQP